MFCLLSYKTFSKRQIVSFNENSNIKKYKNDICESNAQ